MAESPFVGSPEHKALFCRTLTETHDPFDPDRIDWPAIDADSRRRIAALPFWRDAIYDERNAHRKLQALAAAQDDPVLAAAFALQGTEEGRHARIIAGMLRAYGIEAEPRPDAPAPVNPEFAFVKLGYGECCDSFFAFGLFRLAERSGFFPKALTQVFEPIVQEEARHILFFQNWIAYVRASRPALHRLVHRLNCARGLSLSIWSRIRIAHAMQGSERASLRRDEASAFTGFALRPFLELCLAENRRRLAPYDARLLRPTLIPGLVGNAVKLLPRNKAPDPDALDAEAA